MAGRIGNVIYWLACIVAALIAIAGVAIYLAEGHRRSDGIGITLGFFIAAFIAWLIGRAFLYVLSAR
jgi:hypothetical protein